MTYHPLSFLHRLVWTALMAALLAVGAYMHFPLWGVPFSMQPLFALLAGMLLGPAHGSAAVALYLVAGLVGLPVFAGGKAGLAVLIGPTGGYLFGFLVCAGLAGLAVTPGPWTWRRGGLWGLAGLAGVYLLGVAQLRLVLDVNWSKALTIGFMPFIVFDLVKLAVAVTVADRLRAKGLAPS